MHPNTFILHLTFGPNLIAYCNPEAQQYFQQDKCIGLSFKTLCTQSALFNYLDKAFKKIEKHPNSSIGFIWQESEKITLWKLQTIYPFPHNPLRIISLTGRPLI